MAATKVNKNYGEKWPKIAHRYLDAGLAPAIHTCSLQKSTFG
jgi:hypothetical protein